MYRAHEELLADPKVDVVCIATPDRLHAPQAIDAVRAGKDVYCEKPLTHWAQFDLARQLEAAAEETGRIVQVGTQYMADENYAKVAQMIRDGIIGKPVHAQLGYFRRGDWGERMPIDDPNAQPGSGPRLGTVSGRRSPSRLQRVSRFFQWRLYLGLRRRAGHRSARPRLHARLLPAGPRLSGACVWRRRLLSIRP